MKDNTDEDAQKASSFYKDLIFLACLYFDLR